MNKSGRILSIVVLVFAIAATTVSVILALRRNEFRGRADKESATIAAMVKSMEGEGKTSATGLDKAITFTPADPTAKTPEMGSLGWTTYHAQKGQTEPYYTEFDATLKKAKDMAAALQIQRDYLADRLADVARILGMPEEQFKAADLKSLTDAWQGGKAGTTFKYKETGQNIVTFATNVNTRDQAMIESIVKAAASINHPVEKKNFLERQAGADGTTEFGHQALLNDLNTRVDALYARANALAKNITQGMDTISNHNMTWSANKDAVQSEAEYEGALTSLLTDYATLETQLVLLDSKIEELKQTKKELEDTTAQLNKTTAELKAAKDENTALTTKVKDMEKKMREIIKQYGDPTEVFIPKADLHGKILQVNDEYKFVIINLGRQQIREPWVLLVSRGEGTEAKLVARIQVSRSFQKYCIAEILDVPDVSARRNPIKVGDDIYLAKP